MADVLYNTIECWIWPPSRARATNGYICKIPWNGSKQPHGYFAGTSASSNWNDNYWRQMPGPTIYWAPWPSLVVAPVRPVSCRTSVGTIVFPNKCRNNNRRVLAAGQLSIEIPGWPKFMETWRQAVPSVLLCRYANCPVVFQHQKNRKTKSHRIALKDVRAKRGSPSQLLVPPQAPLKCLSSCSTTLGGSQHPLVESLHGAIRLNTSSFTIPCMQSICLLAMPWK